MTTIASVHARQILDSRGNPTVEVEVVTDAGAFGRAAVPSGASTGSHEAVERRDGGSAYGGKAVEGAVASVNDELGPALLGRDVHDQRGTDRLLCDIDGTPDKGRVGANGVLGVSLAVARASAAALGLPLWRSLGGPAAHVLPVPMMNVINGGAHADNALDLQEFMVVPHRAASFAEALRIGSEVYHALKARLHGDGLGTAVGDEGGFAPEISSAEAAIELILAAAGDAGHEDAVGIALDPAMTELYRDGAYHVEGRALSSAQLAEWWQSLCERYPVVSLEDAMAEDDWDGWRLLTERLGEQVQLVGDDLFVTNPERLARGIRRRSRERDPREGESDRHAQRGARCDRAGRALGLPLGDLAPLGRDRGRHDRRHRGGDQCRADQDRCARTLGACRQVQPAAAHRGATRGVGGVPRAERVRRAQRMSVAPRRTKIVCTMGPATSEEPMIERLVAAGMDVARVNCSHGDPAELEALVMAVRAVEKRLDRPLAILADLPGPKLRVARLAEPRRVESGDELVLASTGAAGAEDLELGFELDFARVVRPGSPVMIDDGRVRLRVIEALGNRVRCRVETGGLIRSQKGVNLPGSYLPIPSITDRDREMLEYAVRWDVDYVALSFVRRAEDVEDLKRLVHGLGGRQRVIAKIEKLEAIEQLEAIVAVTDALMVARGDLGVEIGAAEVPMLQKRLIRMGREAGKTVITATQMLESMIDAPEPTRAEASDVANAILDGTSAIMLSGETAVGKYPVEAVDTMVRIAAAVEPEFAYRDTPFEATRQGPRYISDVVGHAACDMAEIIEAAAIIVPTVSGETAREVSRHRPHRPIVACTPSLDVQRQLMLDWAVVPLALDPTKDVETLWLRSIDAVQRAGIAGPGDRVVITSGTNVNRPGATNTILVQTL